MIEKQVQGFGTKEYEIVELLQNLKLSRPVATSIVCLANGQEFSSREIESITGLRQPEISIAMRHLLENKWIETHDVKKTHGKGRSTKIYQLIVTLEDIIKNIEKHIQSENGKLLNNIAKLKSMS